MSLAVAIQMDPIESDQHRRRQHLRAGAGGAAARPWPVPLSAARTWPSATGGCWRGRGRCRCGASAATTSRWARRRCSTSPTLDVILMRQDPPFDMSYITATHLLEHVHPQTLVVNDPVHVRNAPEKLFVTHFDGLMPPTLITSDRDADPRLPPGARDIIVKPLFGNGGAGVFRIRPRRREPERAAGDVHPALPRAGDRAALHAGGARRATSASS